MLCPNPLIHRNNSQGKCSIWHTLKLINQAIKYPPLAHSMLNKPKDKS